MTRIQQIKFNEIEGIRVGHAEDLKAATGATVIISEEGAVHDDLESSMG